MLGGVNELGGATEYLLPAFALLGTGAQPVSGTGSNNAKTGTKRSWLERHLLPTRFESRTHRVSSIKAKPRSDERGVFEIQVMLSACP